MLHPVLPADRVEQHLHRRGRFCYRHSRGARGEPHADALLAAASETLELWAGGELDYPDLAEDIAIEARLALQLTEEIKELDERTAVLLKHADPAGILTSAPGVATITAAAILGRLGDPNRFTSLAGHEPSPAWSRSSTRRA